MPFTIVCTFTNIILVHFTNKSNVTASDVVKDFVLEDKDLEPRTRTKAYKNSKDEDKDKDLEPRTRTWN